MRFIVLAEGIFGWNVTQWATSTMNVVKGALWSFFDYVKSGIWSACQQFSDWAWEFLKTAGTTIRDTWWPWIQTHLDSVMPDDIVWNDYSSFWKYTGAMEEWIPLSLGIKLLVAYLTISLVWTAFKILLKLIPGVG